MPEIVDQPAIRPRLFDRVQILALDILDERNLVGCGIVEIADECGNLVQPGAAQVIIATSDTRRAIKDWSAGTPPRKAQSTFSAR